MDVTGQLIVGNKLKAKHSETLVDYVTKGEIYEVVDVKAVGFFIINDKGKKCYPVSSTFTRIS